MSEAQANSTPKNLLMQAPDKDSPSHIFNRLNDDCIDAILFRVGKPLDYMAISKVCSRFQNATKRVVPSRVKVISVNVLGQNLPYKRVKEFLEFRPRPTMLEYEECDDAMLTPAECAIESASTFRAIAQSCGATITKLHVYKFCPNPNDLMLFTALKNLFLHRSPPQNFLRVTTLTHLNLRNIEHYIDGQSLDSSLKYLLLANPQLRHLQINFFFSARIFDPISESAPCLEHLTVLAPHFDASSTAEANESIVNLRRMRNLRIVDLCLYCDVTLASIINLFANAKIPVEKITMRLCKVLNDNEEVLNLESLKELNVSYWYEDFSMVDLISVLRTQKSIERLGVMGLRKINMSVVENILIACRSIKRMKVWFVVLNINRKKYEKVLKLVKGRASVLLMFDKGNILVPDNVLAENRKWLELKQSPQGPHVTYRINHLT